MGLDTRIKEIEKVHTYKQLDYVALCKTAFEVLNELLQHLEPMWTHS